MRSSSIALIATSLVSLLVAVPADAQAPRTFVSAAGTDNPTCSFAAPCRHFQAAVTATSPGGEVDALDPAGYGPINIDRAVTIEGQGWSYIAPPASGNAITIAIAGGTGNVLIHGVSLNGAGITGGTNGIVFNSGGSLTVTDCAAQNFVLGGSGTGNGILIQPTASVATFVIRDTVFSNNGWAGIYYIPPSGFTIASFIIDHVVATKNGYGIYVDTTFASGGTTVTAISNSIASANSATGLFFTNGSVPLAVSIDNVSVAKNGAGIQAFNTTKVLLTRSVITGNSTGIENPTLPNTFYTYGNNLIDLNTTNINGSLNTSVTLQ